MGYLKITPRDAEMMVRTNMALPNAYDRIATWHLMNNGVVPSLPEAELFSETEIEVSNLLEDPDTSVEIIHLPFHPGQTVPYRIQSDIWALRQFLRWGFNGRIVQDVLMELDIPDKITKKDVEEGLRRTSEKYLKLVRLYVKPLLSLLDKHGLERAGTMIEKAYLRDKLLEQETDSKGRKLPRTKRYRDDKLVEWKAVVPGHGAVSQETQQLTTSHISLLTSIYRSACNFAERCKVDPGLVKTCREEASRLETHAGSNTTNYGK
jgi:hypothetical protein